MKFLDENTVLLCKKGSCCPKVEFDSDGISISDDFGGKVKLTFDEAKMLKDLLNSKDEN